jgi:hypothetical protein
MSIQKRGKPDDAIVHWIRGQNNYPECKNGSWHLLHSDNVDEITCLKCLEAALSKSAALYHYNQNVKGN